MQAMGAPLRFYLDYVVFIIYGQSTEWKLMVSPSYIHMLRFSS